LQGRRIGLDPGHGPRDDLGAVLVDPGTGKLVLSEAEFNLDVALRCRDILLARGAAVVLTREKAGTFTAPWPADANGDGIVGGSKDDLQIRVDILNAFHAEAFISIHANSAVNLTDMAKVQVFYCATAGCASPTESRRLGQIALGQIQGKMAGAGYPVQVPQLHVDTWQDGLHFFELGPINPPGHVRATHMPGVLSETLYITSPIEAAQLKRDTVRQAIALAYADALQAFLTGGGR
jgi:N-acetylmuramoyl-L-alanine amidase